MGAVHYKYTNEQVAGDWDLYRSLATEYVQNYIGSFDLLVQYKERVLLGYGLTVPMVRATLNCMLHDAKVVNLPVPTLSVRDYSSTVRPISTARSFRNYPEVRRHLDGDDEDEIRPLPERLRRVKMKAKWPRDYAMSSNSSAFVIHRIHPNSYVEWDRETDEQKLRAYWRCQAGAHQGVRTPIIFMDALEASILIMQRNRVEFRGDIVGEYVTRRRYLKLCKMCRELSGGK